MKSVNQLELFDTIYKRLSFSAKGQEDENKKVIVLLFSLIWSYYNFRLDRPTHSEQNFFLGSLKIQSLPQNKSQGIYIFPACDIILDKNKMFYESRFLEKVRANLPNDVLHGSHHIIRDYSQQYSKNDYKNLTFIKKPYINITYLASSTFQAIYQILSNLWLIKLTRPITSAGAYWAIFKALVNFYSNLQYFNKLFLLNKKLRFIVISNFYSPENLALIKIANKFNIKSFDIQHGVQRNVVAYERLNKFPLSLRPSEFVKWADKIPSSMNAKKSFINFLNDNIQEKRCLVTLQPSNSEIFLDSLNLLSEIGMQVIVRPHPRRNGKFFLEKLRLKLHKKINISSNTNLSVEFSNSDIHLSEYSSALIESAATGLLSVALHKTAIKYLCDEINEGKILYFSSLKAFIIATKDIGHS